MASQGRGRSQSHTSHSITRDGVTGKCQPTHKEEPSAHRIIWLPEGGAILHSHDSSLSTHTLFSLYFWIHFFSQLFNVFNSVVCSGSHVCLRMYCIILNGAYCVPAMGCYSAFSVQSPPQSPWEFYGPLVCGVASDILIYNLVFVKIFP